MTRLILKDWKRGAKIWANFPLNFPNDNERITRWHNLDELYTLHSGVIAIDEAQKLFDARHWGSLPTNFAGKIAQHRKHHLDIYTTTQDFSHIDVRVRQNVHELINCSSIFRFPRNDRFYPLFQLIKITKKKRVSQSDGERLYWQKAGSSKIRVISRFWTKELYNTYADVGMEKYLCKLRYEKKGWLLKLYCRELIDRGRARL